MKGDIGKPRHFRRVLGPIILATSQIYIIPIDNFPSGNFPIKEKRHIPHEGSIKWTFKFYIIKEFPNFSEENTQL